MVYTKQVTINTTFEDQVINRIQKRKQVTINTTFEDQMVNRIQKRKQTTVSTAFEDQVINRIRSRKSGCIDALFYETILEGVVKCAITGKPIPNVVIKIPELGKEAVTDEKGYFRIINPGLGKHTLYITWFDEKGEYHELPKTVNIEDRETNVVVFKIPYYKLIEERRRLEGVRVLNIKAKGYIHINPKVTIRPGENYQVFYLWKTRRGTNRGDKIP